MLEQGAHLHPRHSEDDLTSQGGQRKLVSNSLEGKQIPAPEEGVLLILSGDDTRLGLSYECIPSSLMSNEHIDAGGPSYSWDWLSVQ